ncbi:hypothetical protein [Desulfuromonas thiophila]|uniref:Uncharacterized protein n=1 Tax=Desulfuromonas thiophila TaxID=57664 RepID=A0A1G7ANZ2_9BACT|nr:hypothetical protein [Desulfuromonas thiophila]SDE15725.1 hypothetical protein SAMN05661003_104111 [Desulfuromonas thiophila]
MTDRRISEEEAIEVIIAEKKRAAELGVVSAKILAHVDLFRRELNECREIAMQKYGTSNLDELRKLLLQGKTENEQNIAKYLDELQKTEEELNRVASIIERPMEVA